MTSINPQSLHDFEHMADLLPAYVNGTLHHDERQRIQQHLLLCSECQHELATWQALRATAQLSLTATPLPSAYTLTQVWTKLDALPQQRQVTRWQSLLSNLLHGWLVFKHQVPLIPISIWLAAPLVILFGGGLAFYDIFIRHLTSIAGDWSLPLFTCVSAATGAAFIYGAENDAGLEITLSTPTSIRLIMLYRMALVVGYNFVLAAIASTVIAIAHGGGLWQSIQMWLGPMLLLSSFTFALSMLLGSWVALLAALILEVAQSLLVDVNKQVAVIQLSQANLWQTNPMMLLLAILFVTFALLYAPRQPRFSN